MGLQTRPYVGGFFHDNDHAMNVVRHQYERENVGVGMVGCAGLIVQPAGVTEG